MAALSLSASHCADDFFPLLPLHDTLRRFSSLVKVRSDTELDPGQKSQVYRVRGHFPRRWTIYSSKSVRAALIDRD